MVWEPESERECFSYGVDRVIVSIPCHLTRSCMVSMRVTLIRVCIVGCCSLLVPVSSTACTASTSGLSTTCSSWRVQRLKALRNPYLGAGFPLRCFQRLSLPNVANQPYPWRDNWHTRGSSTQVLSYYGQASSRFQRAQRIETKLSHDVLNPARVPL